MEIMSPPGRRMLYALPWQTDAGVLSCCFDRVEAMLAHFTDGKPAPLAESIRLQLMQVKEIQGTVVRMAAHESLDDIELFELKNFAMTSLRLRELTARAGVIGITIPDLTSVVDMLDPRGLRVPHFYIYDDYSALLASLRAELKALGGEDSERVDALFARIAEEEDRVRADISAKLWPSAQALREALENVAALDVLQAKAALAATLSLTRPQFVTQGGEYRGLVNPRVSDTLAARGRRFQPVDITLTRGTTVVTGANMAGKSVLLKTLALAQTMAQFGLYVPARQASLMPVQNVLVCIGDEQNELTGLSSFASEMMRIDAILRSVAAGERDLVLIDEPARTTNPVEGKALVEALLRLLDRTESVALVTTHYSALTAPCRRLRVRGFVHDEDGTTLHAREINDYIDYTLVVDDGTDVPHEALRIARLLGVDSALTDEAGKYLE